MSKRFFAIGCSVTNFGWPTWADVVGHSLKEQGYEYYNYGSSGSGNFYMYCTLMAADHKHHFTDDDIIMVMWSSWNRDDRLLVNTGWSKDVRICWTKVGNILTAAAEDGPIYNSDFLTRLWSLENDIVTNILSINHARKLYNINYEDTIKAFEAPENHVHPSDIEDPAQRIFYKFLNLQDGVSENWERGYKDTNLYPQDSLIVELHNDDGHPIPLHHAEYVKNYIQPTMPHLNLCTQSALDMCESFQNKLIEWKREHPVTPPDQGPIWREVAANNWTPIQKTFLDGDWKTLWSDEMLESLLDNFKF